MVIVTGKRLVGGLIGIAEQPKHSVKLFLRWIVNWSLQKVLVD